MSYITRINSVQLFGNNDYFPEWIDFIKSKGIEVHEDGRYNGDIDNFMEALAVIETIVLNMAKRRDAENEAFAKRIKNKNECTKLRGLFDFGYIQNNVEDDELSLFDNVEEELLHNYLFLPHTFFRICKPSLIRDGYFAYDAKHLRSYRLKDGDTIHVSAN